MTPLLLGLPGNEIMLQRLSAETGWQCDQVDVHAFPDGESLPTLPTNLFARDVLLVCSLNHPDARLLPLLFSAHAARQQGARKVGLVAPYLCYMRQDTQFHAGEAITSRAFAGIISQHLDCLFTIDPHLHRYRSLAEIYSIPAVALHAGPAIAAWITRCVKSPFVIGPDQESSQWVSQVAAACGADFTVMRKQRKGDTAVIESAVNLPEDVTPVVLDDIVSSGTTTLATLAQLPHTARERALVIAVHGLLNQKNAETIRANCARLVTTDTVPGPCAEIDVAPILAQRLLEYFP